MTEVPIRLCLCQECLSGARFPGCDARGVPYSQIGWRPVGRLVAPCCACYPCSEFPSSCFLATRTRPRGLHYLPLSSGSVLHLVPMDLDELKTCTPVSLKRAVEGLPRKVLQALSKQYGIKANAKSADIITSLYPRLLEEVAEPAQRSTAGDAAEADAGMLSPVGNNGRYTPDHEQPVSSPARAASPTPPAALLGSLNPLFFVSSDSAAEPGAVEEPLPAAAVDVGHPQTVAAEAAEAAAAHGAAQKADIVTQHGGSGEIPGAAPHDEADNAAAAKCGATISGQQERAWDRAELATEAKQQEIAALDPPPAEPQAGQAAIVSGAAASPNRIKRRVSAAAGRRSSIITKEWKDSQAQKLTELQNNWSSVTTGTGPTNKVRNWKLPSAKDLQQTSSTLAKSGFTVVNSPGKNRPAGQGQPVGVGSKRKAEGAASKGGPLPKAARGSPMPRAPSQAGAKVPTPSRLRNASGPAAPARENAPDNLGHGKAGGVVKPAGAAKPPGLPKAPVSMAERAKAAEAAFTARRVAALQKAQQAK